MSTGDTSVGARQAVAGDGSECNGRTEFIFLGDGASEAAASFWSWVVDGGGEDILADMLSMQGFDCEIVDFDQQEGRVSFKVARLEKKV